MEDNAPVNVDAILQAILGRGGERFGMAAAVLRGERIIAQGAAGVRKRGTAERITLDDRFLLNSCTKPMTATLVAMLVEEGKLSTDDEIDAELLDGQIQAELLDIERLHIWQTNPMHYVALPGSAIDNLIKGLSGAALQCMNLMCGYEETLGLVATASRFRTRVIALRGCYVRPEPYQCSTSVHGPRRIDRSQTTLVRQGKRRKACER